MSRSPLFLRLRSFVVLTSLLGSVALPAISSAASVSSIAQGVQDRLAKRQSAATAGVTALPQAGDLQSSLQSKFDQIRRDIFNQMPSSSSRSSAPSSVSSVSSAPSVSSRPSSSSKSSVVSSRSSRGLLTPRSSSSRSSSSTAPTNGSAFEQKILELVNSERAKVGLPNVTTNILLEKAAEKHALDMINKDYFDHVSPNGQTPTERIKAEGYPNVAPCGCARQTYYGENIARGQKTPEEVMQDWMNSQGHKDNILSKNFKEIGVAFDRNVWVQNFGGVWER